MVVINRRGRDRHNQYPLELFQVKAHPLLKQHFLHLFLVAAIGLFGSLYLLLLRREERSFASVSTQNMFADAASASRLLNKPFLIYGTAWKKDQTARLVQQAINAGFRFIDTACQPKHYNEPGVGAGWKAAVSELGLTREDLFLQTKFTSVSGQDPNSIPYDPDAPLAKQVQQSLEISLRNLQTHYLDSLVLHSPFLEMNDTLLAWRTMESFVDQGKVLRIGISNCYNYNIFMTLYEEARIKPTVLQNRFYDDSHFDTRLRQFCKENGIWYQSFWTLTANRQALASDEIREWAKGKGLTPQVAMYAFLMSMGYVKPLSGTTSLQHMAEDVAIMERMQKGESFFDNEDEMRLFAKWLGMPDL